MMVNGRVYLTSMFYVYDFAYMNKLGNRSVTASVCC